MTLSIRNPEADVLARRLAQLDQSTITEAVVLALKEAIQHRVRRESATQTAERLLKKRGLAFQSRRKPVPEDVWHDLDHDIAGGQ